jgi:hypothetical protein
MPRLQNSGYPSALSLPDKQNRLPDIAEKETEHYMTTRHTFLFREGTWKALGYYSDAMGNVHPMEGESKISRLKNKNIAEVKMVLLGTSASSFVQYFEIPDNSGIDNQNWSSLNMVSGQMEGKVMFMNEYIYLMYNSPDGKYSGVENLERVDDIHYKNHGFAFVNDQKMASWVLDWRRVH